MKKFSELAKIKNYSNEIECFDKKKIFFEYILSIENLDWTLSKKFRSSEIFKDILLNNDSNYIELYEKYRSKNLSLEEKKIIRYGKNGYNLYIDKLKQKRKLQDRSNVIGPFHLQFYINKGLNIEDAKKELEKIYKKAKNKINYKKRLLPNQNEYWIERGYCLEEAEELRSPFVAKSIVSLENFINRYGEEEGKTKFLLAMEKKKLTNIEKTGYPYPFKGSVSRESIKFFLPLYKKIRKLGISKDDIYWGIKGSEEFVINSTDFKTIYFIDFTIKSLKIAIEYNNDYWHPHPDIEWRGIGTKEDRIACDEAKKTAILKREFDLYYVWSFEDISLKSEELYNIIKEKYDIRRKMLLQSNTND